MMAVDDWPADVTRLREFLGDNTEKSSLPRDGTLLRMYPGDGPPRVGSVLSDELDMDSHWHFHDMHQLVHAFEQSIVVESERGRHLVPPQLAAWIPAGTMHRLSLRRVRSGSIFFPTDMIHAPDDRIRTIVATPLMREMLREAMRWRLGDPASELGERFFAAMAGLCEEWLLAETSLFLPTVEDPTTQRALDYTAGHIDAYLTEVCAHSGLTARTLRRRLKKATGLTWEGFRQRSRLLRAVALLGSTSLPIGQVAMECGFESPSAFAKSFRTLLGETPRDYRRRILNV